jgi:spermidine synthase
MNDRLWFSEYSGENMVLRYRCLRTIHSGQSRFARIDIVDTPEYGRMLFLDGIMQSAQEDEFIYHETLVHPAMLTRQGARSVCVIGGAEGATIREVGKYPEVERIVMVDIDEELVNLCRRHLRSWSDGAYEDPRLELNFADGRRYLEQTGELFDVILVDLSDPIPDSPAVYLFTREFYELIHRRLTPRGVACFQGESLKPNRIALHARMVNTLSGVFRWVVAYPYLMPSFHDVYAHILASREVDPRAAALGRRMEALDLKLRYLTPSLLNGFFRMPGYVEDAYARHQEPLSDAQPMFYKA